MAHIFFCKRSRVVWWPEKNQFNISVFTLPSCIFMCLCTFLCASVKICWCYYVVNILFLACWRERQTNTTCENVKMPIVSRSFFVHWRRKNVLLMKIFDWLSNRKNIAPKEQKKIWALYEKKSLLILRMFVKGLSRDPKSLIYKILNAL